MTFLNPLLLIGLAAAAIPIIIHLLNLRKLRTIEFSSLQFLKELQKTKMRRVKIRQWLLLVLRTLLIALIVLAFARPALRGSIGSIGAHARSTIVILFDDSPSMSVRDERGVLSNQAAAEVGNLLNVAQHGDEIYFIRLSEMPERDVFAPTSVSSIRALLDKLTPSLVTVPFRNAIGVAAKILADSRNANQEVYLITDAQATQFISGARDSTNLFDPRVNFFVVGIGKEQNNAGISSLRTQTQIISKTKPVALRAIVGNFGTTPLHNSIMSVYVDGSRVVQQSLNIPAPGTAAVDFTVTPKRRGIIKGFAQLEDDALDADNKQFFVLNVPDNINVLMVGGRVQDTRLASLALSLGGDSTLASLFTTRVTTQAQFSSLDINKFDVLVFCGVKNFTPTDADRVSRFMRSGGGVMLFPDDETDIANLNTTLFARLHIPACQPAEGKLVTAANADEASFLSFDKVDLDHPLFQGMFEQEEPARKSRSSIESPRVYRAIKPRVGSEGRAIITLSDGSPFLAEYATGHGHLLLFSVEADTRWSDFPVKGLFAPLLHRATVYLAGGNQNTSTSVVGEVINVATRLKSEGGKDLYSFVSPEGFEERVIPQTNLASGMSIFESSPTIEAGVYLLRRGRETIHATAVNIDPGESDLRRATDSDQALFWQKVGVKNSRVTRVQSSENLEKIVLESRLGVELWKYVIALAIIIALIEMAVARESKSSSAGTTPA